MAHFPPVRPVMPGTAPEPVPGARRTWLALLLGAGAVALLAGLAWGIITATRAQPGDPSPAAKATRAAMSWTWSSARSTRNAAASASS